MKSKIIVTIMFFLSVCSLLAGCGGSGDEYLGGREHKFIKEDYNEEYSHHEQEMTVEKSATAIRVKGYVTSGAFDLQLIEKDKEGNAVQTLNYQVTDTLDETIELTRDHSQNWVIVYDITSETEGSYTIEVYK